MPRYTITCSRRIVPLRPPNRLRGVSVQVTSLVSAWAKRSLTAVPGSYASEVNVQSYYFDTD